MHNRRPWQPPVYKPQEAPSALLMTPSQSEPSCNVHSHDTSQHSWSHKPWLLSGSAGPLQSFSLWPLPCAWILLVPCWGEQERLSRLMDHKVRLSALITSTCVNQMKCVGSGNSWCIMHTHDASRPMMHHEYSWCIMRTHPWAIMAYSFKNMDFHKHGFPGIY